MQNEQFPSRYYLMYRCQCEVARACLRGIRSFAHFHFFVWMSFFFITQNQTILLNLAFQSLSTDFLFTSVTDSSTSRCGYSSPSSIHFRRISTAFCAFFLHVLLYGGKSRCGVLCIADIVIACHADLLRHGYFLSAQKRIASSAYISERKNSAVPGNLLCTSQS